MDSEEPPNVRVACSGDIDEVVRLMHDAAAWMSAKGTPAWDVARIDRTFAETFVLRSELVWKLDRLGRDLRHLINTVHDLTARGTGLKVLTGHGATIDTTTAAGKLVFGIFAALAEFERELIAERTTAGLASARARGRNGGRPYKMTPVKLRLAMASMGQSETKVSTLCQELGITRQTLYRHISPVGQLRADGIKLLNRG